MTHAGKGKVALITGVTGQDGAYLADLLLEKGYTVHGVKRRSSSFNTGRIDHRYQGNIDARRDWGRARENVRGMWLMLQQDGPDDYVLATGETTPIRDFVTEAFARAKITLDCRSAGVDEQGTCARTGRVYVEIDPRYFRPTEVDLLIGDATKAKQKLGWVPETKWQALCAEMFDADLVAVARERRRNVE